MPSPSPRLLLLTRLLTAVATTATISCGGVTDDSTAAQSGGGSGGVSAAGQGGNGTAGQAGSGGVSAAGQAGSGGVSAAGQGGAPSMLPPSTTGAYPSCTGMDTMFTGPCCKYLECYTPPAGQACLPAPTDAGTTGDPGIPPLCVGVGSGSCSCGSIEGPFAGPIGDPTQFKDAGSGHCIGAQQTPPVSPYQDGTCCYLVPIMGCEGRPLLVEGGLRKAAVRRGEAW